MFFSVEQNKTRKIILNNEEKTLECLMLFKKGIQPEWEDKKNAEGGSLILQVEELQSDE